MKSTGYWTLSLLLSAGIVAAPTFVGRSIAEAAIPSMPGEPDPVHAMLIGLGVDAAAEAELVELAERERPAKSLESFRGGDAVLIIGGSTLLVILLVVLLVLLLAR